MKTLRCLFATFMLCLAIALQPIVLTGCARDPATKTYQVVGTVTVSVDAAMESWGAWVRAGKAPVEDRIRVRAAYIHYQNAMQAAELAAISALNAPSNQPAYVTALNAASAASVELVNLIQSLTKE